MTAYHAGFVSECLEDQRKINDERNTSFSGESVFNEEFLEFVEAVQAGKKKEAKHELIQSIAMLLRIYSHLDEYIAKEQEQTPKLKKHVCPVDEATCDCCAGVMIEPCEDAEEKSCL